jgi:hypothetical protein
VGPGRRAAGALTYATGTEWWTVDVAAVRRPTLATVL